MSAIRARYEITTTDPASAAEQLAGELSCGTFTKLPGETAELRRRHRAEIRTLTPLADGCPDGTRRAELVLEIPSENVGASLIALWSTIAGNVFELRQPHTLALLDFELPDELNRELPGPLFGVAGTRARTGSGEGPIIGTIVKPSVGLTPEETAETARSVAIAGIDFIKDDELIADPPYSPRDIRVATVRRALQRVEDERGHRVTYAPNISDQLDSMLRAQEHAESLGTGAVMVCVNAVGLAGVLALRHHAQAPLHGHRAGWGLIGRGPGTRVGPVAHAKLWRLAGIDQLHTGGLRSKFFEADQSVEDSIGACLAAGSHEPTMPVLSAGQWGGQMHRTLAAAGGPDFMYLAGGAIYGHPLGPRGGVTALRAAANAAVRGESLDVAARECPELASSIEAFGP